MFAWLASLADLPGEKLAMVATGIAALMGAVAAAWRGLRASPPPPPPPPPPACSAPAAIEDLREQVRDMHDILIRIEDRTRK